MMKILNQIHALTGDWSDGELVHDTMIDAGDMIVSLMKELSEAQSYKADAERYMLLAKEVDFGTWFCGFVRDEDEIYMDSKKHMDEAIDQAMKEIK